MKRSTDRHPPIAKRERRSRRKKLNAGSYVFIDWTSPKVTVRQFEVTSGEIELGPGFSADVTGLWGNADTLDQAADLLRCQMEDAGITATSAAVSLPRRFVAVAPLTVPEIEDSELASVVELQLESRSDEPASAACNSFVAGAVVESRRPVFTASVASERVSFVEEIVKAAGLKLVVLSVGEFAIDALSTHQADGLRLNILANEAKTEFVMCHRHTPLATLPVRTLSDADADFDQFVCANSRRLHASLEPPFQNLPIAEVRLFGTCADSLVSAAEVSMPDSVVERVKLLCDRSVRLLALVQSLVDDRAVVEFSTQSSSRRSQLASCRQKLRYGVGLAVLCSLLLLWAFDWKRSLERNLAQVETKLAQQIELNQHGQPLLDAWYFVSRWEDDRIDWANEFPEFTSAFPPANQAYLTQLRIEHPIDSAQPEIRVEGLAADPDVATAINRSLLATRRYEVRPNGIVPSRQDLEYPVSFRVQAFLSNLTEATPATDQQVATP